MKPTRRGGARRGTATRSHALALAVLCAADFLVVLDGLIVAVALPTRQQALGISPAALQWVVNAYICASAGSCCSVGAWATSTAAAAS